MVTTGLVELERHVRDPRAGQGERGALLRHSAPQHQPTDPCTTLTRAATPILGLRRQYGSGRRRAAARVIASSPPTTPMPASGPSPARAGPATWFTSPRPATRARRGLSSTPTLPRPTCTRPNVHEAMRTAAIHEALNAKGLAPAEHLADAGYISAEHLVRAREQHGIELVGPARPDQSWQVQEGAFLATDFTAEWDQRRVRCPEGHESTSWGEYRDKTTGRAFIRAGFSPADCRPCPARSRAPGLLADGSICTPVPSTRRLRPPEHGRPAR